jgi:hypothetical protein
MLTRAEIQSGQTPHCHDDRVEVTEELRQQAGGDIVVLTSGSVIGKWG